MTGNAQAAPGDKNKAPVVDEKLVNPLDKQAAASEKDSGLIKGIVSTETGDASDNILEAAPELDLSLLKEVEPPKSILLLILKIVFTFVLLTGVVSLSFFSSQLTSNLDFITSNLDLPNVSKQLTASNSEIIQLQTELNLNKVLQAKAYLDEFSYYGDSFVQNYEVIHSQTTGSDKVDEAESQMEFLRPVVTDAYNLALSNYTSTYAAPLFTADGTSDAEVEKMFREKLNSELDSKAAQFSSSTDPGARREYKNFIHTKNIVGNNQLYALLANADLVKMDDTELYTFIKEVNTLTVNDLSIIQQIKDGRIRWSDVMNEIDLRTIAVDKYYNTGNYDLLGGIRYTSYDIDSEQHKITIVGETKRFDTINFTMISNLIDELNNSKLFTNAEMRSFSKSGSVETGYTSSVRLALDLKNLITGDLVDAEAVADTGGKTEEDLKNELEALFSTL